MSYRIGTDSGVDGLHLFWNHSIRDDRDRLECLAVNEREFRSACVLKGRKRREYPDVACIASVANIFLQAMKSNDGVCQLPELEKTDSHDPKLGLFRLRIMERKLAGLHAVRNIYRELCSLALVFLWFAAFTSQIKISVTVGLSILVYSSTSVIASLRRFILKHIILFFDESLIPVSHARKLITFSLVLVYCSSQETWIRAPAFSAVSVSFTCAILSNLVPGYSSARWLMRGYMISFLCGNVLVYWFLFENLRLIPWIAVPVILEWRIISSAMSIVTMVSILIVAFISDVVQQIRKEIILRIVFSITLSLSFAVAFVFIDGSWRTGATTALSVILIPIWFPTLPRRVKHALRNSTLSFLALIESMYRLFLTIQATFVIFQHSVPLGWRWLRHISQREPFPSTTLEIRKP